MQINDIIKRGNHYYIVDTIWRDTVEVYRLNKRKQVTNKLCYFKKG